MADWPRFNILPSNAPGAELLAFHDRVLQDTSGNIQTYASEAKHEGESLQYHRQALSLEYSRIQPVRNQLPSNDHVGKIQRLQYKRGQRQRIQHSALSKDRLWIDNAYQKYRERSERGKQRNRPDEEVWSENVEQAFYDALMNIPCYGRKKKSQNNRPHGRNELIALWIKKATGVERTRKQISSHIQVLKTKMKGNPDWDKVSTPQHDDVSLNGLGNRYYSNSIENDVETFYGKVKRNHALQSIREPNTPTASIQIPLPEHALVPNAGAHVSSLNFKMWVSPKDHHDFRERVWDYTCSADDQGFSSAPPMNLESLPEWRQFFPDLPSIIAKNPLHVKLDIILVSAGLKLMGDHPPPRSQLGLNLELDLSSRGSSKEISSVAQILDDWHCITRIYKYGQPVEDHEPIQFPLCEPSSGKLNTSFESKWWAKQFTLLTECRREAEDDGSDAKLATADERFRHFFNGTTAMQEFRATAKASHDKANATSPGELDTHDTIIVLLWKFHQVPCSNIGTTSWRVLVPPPDRTTTNSPHPLEDEMSFPSLAIDSRLSSEFQFQHHHSPFHDPNDPYPIYPDTLPNPDFMPAAHNFDFFRAEEEIASFNSSSFELPVSDLPISDIDVNGNSAPDFSQSHHALDFPSDSTAGTGHALSYCQSNHQAGPVLVSAPFLPPTNHQFSTTSPTSANRHQHQRRRPALAELAHHVRETHDTLQASLAAVTTETTTSTAQTISQVETEAGSTAIMVSDEEIRAAIAGLEGLEDGIEHQREMIHDHGVSGGAEWVNVVELTEENERGIIAAADRGESDEGAYYQERQDARSVEDQYTGDRGKGAGHVANWGNEESTPLENDGAGTEIQAGVEAEVIAAGTDEDGYVEVNQING